ncbi:hypothetical protein EMIHUDRAFT_202355 [Emiliania huxleyi CCMP1516]|uniref:Fibrinogen C-terminal domain-containing protein n=2 Tax=Emiliania huxleyi TaxID=2903 RepID=A0A0D3KBL9_EMIH1|nr:hypothetical protein EMIHUDRAFT_202355 [Emiliania huxleyi CCMP1516]EOD33154.1 hypothetical protein EMIHUDRAFT_202355 [Emiliania huxleyi CCMP1516]|eukprot:XP_005785583.1 hypothetical protein EMIHUDRAFT_202355 [Emiliania huxleyi CCMP1516]
MGAQCWEYLLNARTGENKSAVCPSPGRPGHGSPTDAAHVLEGFNRDSALDKYSYACKEFGGAGWAATVLRCSKHTAIVRFTIATTRDGRPYEDARVPLNQLRPLPPRQLAA